MECGYEMLFIYCIGIRHFCHHQAFSEFVNGLNLWASFVDISSGGNRSPGGVRRTPPACAGPPNKEGEVFGLPLFISIRYSV